MKYLGFTTIVDGIPAVRVAAVVDQQGANRTGRLIVTRAIVDTTKNKRFKLDKGESGVFHPDVIHHTKSEAMQKALKDIFNL